MKSIQLASMLILFLFGFGNLSAQDKTKNDSLAINQLKPGMWSIQFRVSSDFTLSSFDAANLAVKRQVTDKGAVRIGLTLRGRNTSDEYNKSDEYLLSDTTDVYNNRTRDDGDYNDITFGLNFNYIYYPEVNKKIILYLGAGPLINYAYSNDQYERRNITRDTLEYIEDYGRARTTYEIGIMLLGGVEYFILDYLSLHAEYGSAFYYRVSDNKMTMDREYFNSSPVYQTQESDTKDSGYYFSAKSVLFGLSVYF